MCWLGWALLALLALAGCSQAGAGQPPGNEGNALKLKVDGFGVGEEIPARFTCDGADERPDFSWSEAPEGTKSFALSVIDYDVPKQARADGIWAHWLVKDLPARVTQVKGREKLPVGAVEVANDFGRGAWGGPCPPDRRHNYYFRVYALKVEKLGGVDLDDFHERAKAQSLAVAEVVASYERKK
ncbi:MAG TPA: YbhB/YbcL family Raf kinase inhibitor-like protein [Candidatus Diapherotrites archaeon]|uniref:YbhB/YbcL family Raf kinase inhibitor-like protein n=1 Tax=Candidatus Iainarchaeum sp. TaxID=3101447 RepID=A0A7J4JE13_9ARCH|nr:YbhB/YbcL family Raf kinase inhibitor-like protein [Candidatus Diapherotrites archaeon]HIH15991.1 YbhB/YbcL family Raf kinase inhibitor-like protein [Candidatus Diapherotrites archaeon]